MTASNPCCECKCPHPRDHSNICDTCGLRCDLLPIKETPAAKFCECKFPLIDHSRNGDVCQVCCLSVVDADWQNKEGFIEKKIVPPQPAAVEKAKPYFSFSPKLKPLTDAEKKEMIAGISFEPEKDIEENLRLMNHGIIYQQPAKEWWEEEFDKFNDFFDKYDSDNWFARGQIKLLIREVAAQSEKKGRDGAVDYIEKHCEGAEYEHGSIWRSVNDSDLAAARSSEESDADKAKRIGHYPDGTGVGWERRYDAPRGEEGKTV